MDCQLESWCFEVDFWFSLGFCVSGWGCLGFSVFWRICAGVADFVWPLLGVSVLRGGGRDGQPYGYEDLLGPNFFKDPPYITVIYPRKSRRPEHPLPAPGFTPFPLGSAPRSRRCDVAVTRKTVAQLVTIKNNPESPNNTPVPPSAPCHRSGSAACDYTGLRTARAQDRRFRGPAWVFLGISGDCRGRGLGGGGWSRA